MQCFVGGVDFAEDKRAKEGFTVWECDQLNMGN